MVTGILQPVTMNEFEKKLQAYRAQEKRKEHLERFKNIVLQPVKYYRRESEISSDIIEDEVPETVQQYENVDSNFAEPADAEENVFSWKKFLLNFFVWCCFFRYAVYIEFGAVFLLLSGFYLIWTNTRTGPKKSDEMSAYSVFNPNCERIEGTLDAEQFEKEIRYGMII